MTSSAAPINPIQKSTQTDAMEGVDDFFSLSCEAKLAYFTHNIAAHKSLRLRVHNPPFSANDELRDEQDPLIFKFHFQ